MKMWLGSRHWCITISISKGATRLPCPKRLLVVSCVRCVILMSWTTEGVYPNFLFICGVQEYVESIARRPGISIQQG